MSPQEVAMHLTKALIENRMHSPQGLPATMMGGEAAAVGQAYVAIYNAVLSALDRNAPAR